MEKKLSKFINLYIDARSHRSDLDNNIIRWRELYRGTDKVRNKKTGGYSKKPAYCYKNMIFELIEAQITNNVPSPKVTARDPKNKELASTVESYLKSEIDRMQFSRDNDIAERLCYVDGTVFFLVEWDSYSSTPISDGELKVKVYPVTRCYPQPGVTRLQDCEYIFTIDLMSTRKIKKIYHKDVPDDEQYKGFATIVTAHYINNRGYYSRYSWVENTEIVICDEDSYELRKFRDCAVCGANIPDTTVTECPVCGSNKFSYESEEFEKLPDDIISTDNPQNQPVTIATVGELMPYYKIKCLPFVARVNISQADTIYGVSDVGVLENNQELLNKIVTKMEENVMKGGSIVTAPEGVNIPNTDDTLKMIKVKDPATLAGLNVFNVQASIQQEDILQSRVYQFGRESVGITESYQGKRDNTAESGIAKQIAAQQSAGRLESKRTMKDAAYEELYEMMFKFLLAYCDETRTYTKITPEGDYIEGKFSRYSFIDQTPTKTLFYNDRFLFSVDNASLLSTNREAMWRETVNNFSMGTFGNPVDPTTLMLFWNTMKNLGYPLAAQALASIRDRAEELPYEIQQAIMQNPEILQAVKSLLAGGGSGQNASNKQ